jgi:hypothetical protein
MNGNINHINGSSSKGSNGKHPTPSPINVEQSAIVVATRTPSQNGRYSSSSHSSLSPLIVPIVTPPSTTTASLIASSLSLSSVGNNGIVNGKNQKNKGNKSQQSSRTALRRSANGLDDSDSEADAIGRTLSILHNRVGTIRPASYIRIGLCERPNGRIDNIPAGVQRRLARRYY